MQTTTRTIQVKPANTVKPSRAASRFNAVLARRRELHTEFVLVTTKKAQHAN